MKPEPHLNPSAQPFPTRHLPPRLAAMVKAIAEVYRVPEVMPAAIALAIVSAAIGKGLRVASAQGRKTMGNLFLLISAGSGTGKSTVLRILREPLDIIQAHLKEFGFQWPKNGSGRLSTGGGGQGFEGFVGSEASVDVMPKPTSPGGPKRSGRRKKKVEEGYEVEEDDDPRLICSEITGPAFARLLEQNHQVILNATAEAGNLLDESSRVASPLGQLLLKGYSGDQVEIDRVTRKPIVLDEPCISVCWVCQHHRLEDFLSSDRLLEDGLLARFLVAHTNAIMAPISENDVVLAAETSDAYGVLVENLFSSYGRNARHEWLVEPDCEARRILIEYHNQSAERWLSDSGSLHSCIARWTEQAWKLALVLHAATHGAEAHSLVVDRSTAESAVAIHRWFANQQVRIIEGGTFEVKSARLSKLCDLLRDAANGEMTLRNLQNSHGFSNEEVKSLAMLAPQTLLVKTCKRQGGGRPSEVVSLLRPDC